MSTEKELYITLNTNCNFRCEHCVTSSEPGSDRLRMSEDEVQKLTKFVNESSAYTAVHFTGGEPTLALTSIKKIQKAIKKPIFYTMTTNGWFGAKKGSLLDKFNLDKLVISFDRFRLPFVTYQTIQESLEEGKKRGLETVLKLVIDDESDLALLDEFDLDGIKIDIQKIVYTGRYRDSFEKQSPVAADDSWKEQICPSLGPRKKGKQRSVFISNKGLTPCCGPLAHDTTGDLNDVFQKLESDEPSLLEKSFCEPLGETFKRLGIDEKGLGLNSICEACEFIHENNTQAGLPSLYKLLNLNIEKKQTLPIKNMLSAQQENALGGARDLAYLFSGTLNPEYEYAHEEVKSSIEESIYDESCFQQVWPFIDKIFFDVNAKRVPKEKKQEALTIIEEFAKGSEFAKVFKKADTVVGFLMAKKFNDEYGDRLHIGFVGVSDHGLSSDDKRYIKYRIFKTLEESGQNRLTARIDWFNQRSKSFFTKLGLSPSYLFLGGKW